MAVVVHVEVDLRHAVEPDRGADVEQHRDLDAVAGRERQPLEQLAARGDLARERLAHSGELRIEGRERGRAIRWLTRRRRRRRADARRRG